MGIDRVGGANHPINVGRVDDDAAVTPQAFGQGLFARSNLTITESPLTKSAAELGFEAEPTRNDELTPLLSRYNYPPPPPMGWLKG